MLNWEYRVETVNTEYQIDDEGEIDHSPPSNEILQTVLNECGASGWELVAFIPAAPAKHLKGAPQNPWVLDAIFKRPVAS